MQQKIYPVEKHKIELEQIDADALYVMKRLQEAGHIAYLVGGSVRDLILKKKPKDCDISTSAKPEEIRKLFRNCILIGRRFRLAHIRFGKHVLEVSTFRAGDTETDALIIRDNDWGTPEEDVLRRDFTINGLFYDPATQTVIDYVEGYPDTQKKYLRTIGQPYLRFKQDPVRMIRCLKFIARFNFDLDPETRNAMIECRAEILKSSPARMLEELLRMLESGAAAPFFRLLAEYGFLELLLPELSTFLETGNGDEVYALLQEIDTHLHSPHIELLDRSILLACLVFPILEKRIKTHFLDRDRYPHLGEILNETYMALRDVFSNTFLLPRKMRMRLAALLASQYRIAPLDQKPRRHRVPGDPDFPLAMKFFELRACLEPGLQKIVGEWKEAMTAPSRSRARRRRRKKRNPPAQTE